MSVDVLLSVFSQEGSPGKEPPHKQSLMGLKEARMYNRSEGQSNFKEGLPKLLTWPFPQLPVAESAFELILSQ